MVGKGKLWSWLSDPGESEFGIPLSMDALKALKSHLSGKFSRMTLLFLYDQLNTCAEEISSAWKKNKSLNCGKRNERREEENTKAAGKKAADQKVGIYLFPPLFPSSLTRRWRDRLIRGPRVTHLLPVALVLRVAGSPVPPESDSSTFQTKKQFAVCAKKGQPIRLFAESDKERRLRLRALELIEERGTERHGGAEWFQEGFGGRWEMLGESWMPKTKGERRLSKMM